MLSVLLIVGYDARGRISHQPRVFRWNLSSFVQTPLFVLESIGDFASVHNESKCHTISKWKSKSKGFHASILVCNLRQQQHTHTYIVYILRASPLPVLVPSAHPQYCHALGFTSPTHLPTFPWISNVWSKSQNLIDGIHSTSSLRSTGITTSVSPHRINLPSLIDVLSPCNWFTSIRHDCGRIIFANIITLTVFRLPFWDTLSDVHTHTYKHTHTHIMTALFWCKKFITTASSQIIRLAYAVNDNN